MRRFWFGVLALFTLTIGLVLGPPTTALAVDENFPISVYVEGVPAGFTGVTVTTTCREVSGQFPRAQDGITTYPITGGRFVQIFDSSLSDCSLRTELRGASVDPLVPTVEFVRDGNVSSGTASLRGGTYGFDSGRFSRTANSTMIVRWYFPQVRITRQANAVPEVTPGFTYRYSVSCKNGADVIPTGNGLAAVPVDLKQGASRIIGVGDFPLLRTSSTCIVEELDGGGLTTVFEAPGVQPRIQLGPTSPYVYPYYGYVIARPATYGALSVTLGAESESLVGPSPRPGPLPSLRVGLNCSTWPTPTLFGVDLRPGETWRSPQILTGAWCTVSAEGTVPAPGTATAGTGSLAGVSLFRTDGADVRRAPANYAVIVTEQTGKVCPPVSSGVFVGVTTECSDPVYFATARNKVLTLPVPKRVLDTRETGGPIQGGTTRTVNLRMPVLIPQAATGVFVNVTAVSPSAKGYVTLFPCDGPIPNTANVTFAAGEVSGSLGFVGLDSSDRVCAFASATTDLVLDVVGYVWDTPIPASFRLYDSRPQPTGATVDGQGVGAGVRPAGSVTMIRAVGRGGVQPSDDQILLNVWAVSPQSPGWLTVYPCNATRPNSANVNYAAGQNIGNLATVVLWQGDICVYNSSATDLVVDAVASPDWPSAFVLSNPQRYMDTRSVGVTIDGQYQGMGAVAAGSVTELQVTGAPTRLFVLARVAVVNVTVIQPTTGGWVTVYACDQPRPFVSSLNYAAGDVRGNLVLSRISASGKVCLFSSSAAHLVVDALGSFQ
jgi:hypothetical protein